MSETETNTATPEDAMPKIETAAFLYSKRGPIQSIPFRVIDGEGEAAKMVPFSVDLRPGKPCALPANHPITESLLAANLIEAIENDDDNEGSAEGDDPAKMQAGDERRIATIVTVLPDLTAEEQTTAGRPRVDALETRLGWKPTTNEIDAAIAAEQT